MLRPRSRGWGSLLALVLLLPACGDASDETAEPDSAASATENSRATTVAAPSTTAAPAAPPVELPVPGEAWDLLFFGFDDVFTPLTAELYAEHVAGSLGTEVRLSRPSGFEHVWATNLLAQLKGERYPPLGDLVPPAEVIVLLSRPGESTDGSDDYIVEDFERCRVEWDCFFAGLRVLES